MAIKAYREWRYGSLYSLLRQQIEVTGQPHATAALAPRENFPLAIKLNYHVGIE
jgi:hypothetical protein